MRLLLGSGGFGTEERRDRFTAALREHLGDVDRVLFVPFAVANHERAVERMRERHLDAGYVLDSLHHHGDPRRAVSEAPAVFVGGGNTFRLARTLQELGLVEPLRDRVRQGIPYVGVSAGSNVACPTLMTTNDMPITRPPSFETLGLVPFQINPHYFPGPGLYRSGTAVVEHFGETRDDRIREYHELNELPVLGLYEGGMLRVRDGTIELLGAPARLFRRWEEPLDLEPGDPVPLAAP